VAAGGEQAREQRVVQAVGTQTAVPREIYFGGMATDQIGSEGLAERFYAVVGEFGVGDAANIVFPENSWQQHSSEV
jgi:hypothetical protein